MPSGLNDNVMVMSPLVDFSSAGALFSFYHHRPYKVRRIMLMIGDTDPTGPDAAIEFQHYYAGGAVVPAGSSILGEITIPNTMNGGDGRYMNVPEFVGGTPWDIFPGEYVRIETDGGCTTGDGFVCVEVEMKSFQDSPFPVRDQGALTTPDDAVMNTWLARATQYAS